MMNPPSFVPRGKEGASITDDAPKALILENPDQRTIVWTIDHLPFEPRWSAVLERKGIERRAITTAEVDVDTINGHLKFKGIHRSGFGDLGSEGELDLATGGAPDRIVFRDSLGSTNSGWKEFREAWLPRLTAAGYEIYEAILANFFDPQRGINRGRAVIAADNLIAGVVVDRGAIWIYGNPKPRFPLTMSQKKAESLFNGASAFQASLTSQNATE